MKYLTVKQVIEIHDNILQCFGGLSGIRDRNLLESAIENPKTCVFGQEMYPTVFDKAAAYLFSISRNHPFLDGNKRTAASTCLIFLRINRKQFEYDADDFVNFVLETAQGNKDIKAISEYLEILYNKKMSKDYTEAALDEERNKEVVE